VGDYEEDHRFGADSIATGSITDTTDMPGVFKAQAIAIDLSLFAGISAVGVDVQFARPFRLTDTEIVSVPVALGGSLKTVDDGASASVLFNGGLALPDGTIILSVLSSTQQSVNLMTPDTTLPVALSGSKSLTLEPGDYLVWGGLRLHAQAPGALLRGGIVANANFLSTGSVDLSATPVPEPTSVALLVPAVLALLFTARKLRGPSELVSTTGRKTGCRSGPSRSCVRRD
jgi:hypothetical protein